MPVGNITPRTDDLTLTDMLLGSEEYPSSVQQAGEANTGYLLYRPMLLGGESGAQWDIYTNGGNHYGRGYLLAGKYDFIGVITGNLNGTMSVSAGGTVVSSFEGASGGTNAVDTVSSYTHAGGSILISAYGTGANSSDRVSGWSIWFRQYE